MASILQSVPTGRARIVVLRPIAFVICVLALVTMTLLSLRIGSIDITTHDAMDALFDYDPESLRADGRPLAAPAAHRHRPLASARRWPSPGATMQAVTRNPLAGPSILGVSSGAASPSSRRSTSSASRRRWQYVWFAFAGALAPRLLVYGIGSAGEAARSPVKLALAGVVVSALLGAWTTALLLLDEQTLDIVRFWLPGSLAGRSWTSFWTVAAVPGRRRDRRAACSGTSSTS